jgi:hypothetical protein
MSEAYYKKTKRGVKHRECRSMVEIGRRHRIGFGDGADGDRRMSVIHPNPENWQTQYDRTKLHVYR